MGRVQSQVYRIDFTLSLDRDLVKLILPKNKKEDTEAIAQDLRDFFNQNSENYVFQLELTGDSNYHFQGRINLKVKKRCSEFAKQIEAAFPEMFYRINCSPTSVHCTNFNYVMKPETRISGPWANKPLFLGRSILSENQLQHWHHRVIMLLRDYDLTPLEFRKLINITDTQGGGGKSSLVRHLSFYYEQDTSYVDIWGTLSQISNSIVGEGARKMYLVDLPKAFQASSTKFSGDKVEQLASLLERVKDGGPLKGTMRGGFKQLLFDPPIVLLFSNWSVNSGCFTADRLVTCNLADLYIDPNEPKNLHNLRSWEDLPSSWKWFFDTGMIYQSCIDAAFDHDNGVQ